jgi:predicted O-methyltransferase YrrM
MIKQLIRLHKPQNILEIGTAIGYSAMQFASVSKDVHITTIERDSDMQQQAKENIRKYDFSNQVTFLDCALAASINIISKLSCSTL